MKMCEAPSKGNGKEEEAGEKENDYIIFFWWKIELYLFFFCSFWYDENVWLCNDEIGKKKNIEFLCEEEATSCSEK